MFQAVLDTIKTYGPYSEKEEDDFCSLLQTRELRKGEELLTIGQTCQEFCFLLEGSFVQSYKDHDLNEVVTNLFTQHDWVLDHASFTGQKPSLHSITAFEDSTIQTLNIHDLHALIGRSPSFFALGKILEMDIPFANPKLTPDEKYALLLDQKPSIIQTFPLKIIASYLGMTPETLSRVRRRVS